MKTGKIEDKTSRYSVIVSGDTKEALEKNMELVRKTLNIEVQTDEGVKTPIWE